MQNHLNHGRIAKLNMMQDLDRSPLWKTEPDAIKWRHKFRKNAGEGKLGSKVLFQ